MHATYIVHVVNVHPGSIQRYLTTYAMINDNITDSMTYHFSMKIVHNVNNLL